MSEAPLRDIVLSALGEIAPEADLDAIDPDASIQEQFDIDSMDFLDFAIRLHEMTGVEIPEMDYPQASTLNDCIAYLEGHGALVRG